MALPLGPVIETWEVSRAERVWTLMVFAVGLGAAVAVQAPVWMHRLHYGFTFEPGKAATETTWCLLAIPIDLMAIGRWWRWGRRSFGWSLALAILVAPVWFFSLYFAFFVIGPIRVFLWHVLAGGG